ncbi:hypothetical protein ABID59_004958 [Bradyrhizobium sp. S3.3.6]|uniref:hypothetical protein n=1 Tax=Bradyrhizobium sp. S3.3.6 TaxID=3156429 RepID=UPI0033912BB9
MRCAISMVLTLLLSPGVGQAEQAPSSPFCIITVRDGAPTEKDHNQAWRMMDKMIMLPGVPRPIIYAIDRGGVWTIDENRAFVPFGGDFPQNIFWDKLAHDPETGRFVGVNAHSGIFALDPGGTQFTRLYGVSKAALRHPYSVEFIPRFNGFVISDASGLYLLDRAGALKPLPVFSLISTGIPFTVFDLPAFDALLINASIQGPAMATGSPAVVVRYDDGQAIVPTSLKRYDFVRGITVGADGSISVRTQFDHRTVRLSRIPNAPIAQGQSFVVEERLVRLGTTRIEARSIGKIIAKDPKSGLAELGPGGPAPIALPFDPIRERIDDMVDMPEYSAVLIITNASAYMLRENGGVSEIRGAREVGVSPITASKIRLIPVRNETIFLGRNSINLLVDTRISGEAACNSGAPPRPSGTAH